MGVNTLPEADTQASRPLYTPEITLLGGASGLAGLHLHRAVYKYGQLHCVRVHDSRVY